MHVPPRCHLGDVSVGEGRGEFRSGLVTLRLILSVRSLDRSFAKPPKAVQTVCECIAILRGLKEISWKSAKGMMSDPNFLRQLKEMDVDNIGPKQTSAVKGRPPYRRFRCCCTEPFSEQRPYILWAALLKDPLSL